MKQIYGWLERQELWQIYKSPPKYIPRLHWTVSEVNKIHQADLLFLPRDKVGRKMYKYALVVKDVASRFVDSEAITSKESLEVAKAFETNYSRKKLTSPETIIFDPGPGCSKCR